MLPDENSVLSYDLDPELWLEFLEEEEEEEEQPPPPPKRHFANIGRLPAPDPIVPPPKTTTTSAAAKQIGEPRERQDLHCPPLRLMMMVAAPQFPSLLQVSVTIWFFIRCFPRMTLRSTATNAPSFCVALSVKSIFERLAADIDDAAQLCVHDPGQSADAGDAGNGSKSDLEAGEIKLPSAADGPRSPRSRRRCAELHALLTLWR
jgi:hypothetical protein